MSALAELFALLAIIRQSLKANRMLTDPEFFVFDFGNAEGVSEVEPSIQRLAMNQQTSIWVMVALSTGIVLGLLGNLISLSC